MRFQSVLFVISSIISAFVANSQKISYQNRPLSNRSYEIYWNIPTFQCASHQIDFTALVQKYKINQNQYDEFRGDVISILYDPGAFPAILTSPNGSKVVLRNGGVPQEGNLTLHLKLFRDKINELIPNKNFPGIGVIDFESWRPIFRQNFGTLAPYKELSYDIEKQLHPFWPNIFIEKEAERRFEWYGKIFMEETLIYAKQLRSKATWGYYAYPYCFNMSPNNMNSQCPNEIRKENDRLDWLFVETDNLNPSLYIREKNLTPKERQQLITGRIQESQRLIKQINKPQNQSIIPYFWYKYQDSKNFLSKDDIYNSLYNLKKLNVDGLILWGSSNDVNSKANCQKLYDYVDKVLGPAIENTV